MRRLVSVLLAAACSVGLLVAPAAAAAADDAVTIQGRGFGHGRGMGQYGSLGYAVDRGWSSAQILDHYYGGTRAGSVGNPVVGVELLSLRDRALLVTGRNLTVNGVPVGDVAVQVARVGPTQFRVLSAPGCGGPWTDRLAAGTDVTVASATGVELCDFGYTRGYAGDLRMVLRPGGTAVVNQLPVEEYLKGVVPRESPAGWASAGGGRGAQALQAQAVAARSYALSSRHAPYAQTCDTTACQVYGGAFLRHGDGAVTLLEDARTNAAVAATAGLVRIRPDGVVARTEFSSSTGGWSAGGEFPPVEDLGDGTASNPNRSWSVRLSRADVSARLGVGTVTDMRVSRRNGLGADGGRVLEVVVTTTGGPVTLSGATVRSRLGLKSDWFTVSGFVDPRTSEPLVKALWADLLGRAPSPPELQGRSTALASGTTTFAMADELSRSGERAQLVVVATYRTALGRTPGQGEIQGWVAQYQGAGSVPLMQAGILASQEAWLAGGGTAEGWVDRMYQVTLGRAASPAERSAWAARVPVDGRYAVAMSIGGSVEAANRRLSAYYQALLGRAPDPSSAGWVPYLVGGADGDVRLLPYLAGSVEYAARARSRF